MYLSEANLLPIGKIFETLACFPQKLAFFCLVWYVKLSVLFENALRALSEILPIFEFIGVRFVNSIDFISPKC